MLCCSVWVLGYVYFLYYKYCKVSIASLTFPRGLPICLYSIFTLSLEVSRFKSTNNKSQLYHTDIHVQVLIAFND